MILNRDNKQFSFLENRAQEVGIPHILTFGQHAKADFRLADFEGGAEGSTIWAVVNGETMEVHIGAPGRHIAENAMAALGVVALFGEQILRRRNRLWPICGR